MLRIHGSVSVIEGLEMDTRAAPRRCPRPSPRPRAIHFSARLRMLTTVCLSAANSSPLIDHTTPEQEELKALAGGGNGQTGVITKHHSHHYCGFAEMQWKLFLKTSPRRLKPLLYVYRALLTGIHLMRTGKVEANLVTLNEEFRLPYISDLVARKLAGPEKSTLDDADVLFHQAEYERLRGELQAAHEVSQLPEAPSEETKAALNDLLVKTRLRR